MTVLHKLRPVAERLFAARHLENLANLLDNRFTLPGTRFRFGWDFLLGLIPVAGDLVAAILAGYIVASALYLGARPGTVVRMLGNMLADFLIGLIPVLGDWLDAGFMANTKNIKLLLADLEQQAASEQTARPA